MASLLAPAQQMCFESKVFFPVSQSGIGCDEGLLDELRRSNIRTLAQLEAQLDTVEVLGVYLQAWASPEGSSTTNRSLVADRTDALCRYLKERCQLADSLLYIERGGVAWDQLAAMVRETHPAYEEAVLGIIADGPARGEWDTRRSRLMSLRAGDVWRDMAVRYFPYLRYASLVVISSPRLDRGHLRGSGLEGADLSADTIVTPESGAPAAILVAPADAYREKGRSFFMSVHTNMLFDAVAVPNIGAEFYLGKNITVAANWWYAWWNSDSRARYWRTYGGYLAGRLWLGRAAKRKPLTGHHIGVYGQIMLYDFEWGGKGYLSGNWGRNIFDHPTFGFGIEYGYSLPVASRINIDFTIGLGYLGGRYYVYRPIDGHYVWLSTHERKWWGPTKAEVSLVWLIGRGNTNTKGGAR